jgi:hypothetical protein
MNGFVAMLQPLLLAVGLSRRPKKTGAKFYRAAARQLLILKRIQS